MDRANSYPNGHYLGSPFSFLGREGVGVVGLGVIDNARLKSEPFCGWVADIGCDMVEVSGGRQGET